MVHILGFCFWQIFKQVVNTSDVVPITTSINYSLFLYLCATSSTYALKLIGSEGVVDAVCPICNRSSSNVDGQVLQTSQSNLFAQLARPTQNNQKHFQTGQGQLYRTFLYLRKSWPKRTWLRLCSRDLRRQGHSTQPFEQDLCNKILPCVNTPLGGTPNLPRWVLIVVIIFAQSLSFDGNVSLRLSFNAISETDKPSFNPSCKTRNSLSVHPAWSCVRISHVPRVGSSSFNSCSLYSTSP